MTSRAAPGPVDYGLLIGLAAMWGASFLLSKMAVETLEPVTATLGRQIVAAAVFAVIVLFTGERQAMSRADHVNAFLTAALGTGIPFALITWGVVEVDASIAAIMMGLMPLAVLLLAHVTTDDEKLNAYKLMGVALGFSGLIELIWPQLTGGETAHGGSAIRHAAVLLAALCYAVNALVTKRLGHLKPRPLYALVMAWTIVILLPLSVALETPSAATLDLRTGLVVLALGLFPSALGSLVLFMIVSRQGASFFGQINFLVPLFGVLWGALILGERLTVNSGAALALILAGVLVARRRPSAAPAILARKDAP